MVREINETSWQKAQRLKIKGHKEIKTSTSYRKQSGIKKKILFEFEGWRRWGIWVNSENSSQGVVLLIYITVNLCISSELLINFITAFRWILRENLVAGKEEMQSYFK